MNGTPRQFVCGGGARARAIVAPAFSRVVPAGRVNIVRVMERIPVFRLFAFVRRTEESRSAKLAPIRFVCRPSRPT
jgi:hypothetical protein